MSVLVVVAILRTGGFAYAKGLSANMHTARIVMKSNARLLLFMGIPLLKDILVPKTF